MNYILIGNVFAVVWCIWFCHFYGATENRWFKEHGEPIVLNHFSLYHSLWLAPLFGFHSFIFAHSLHQIFNLSMTQTGLLFFAWMLYSPVALDWVWWLIRHLDITHLHGGPVKVMGRTLWTWPDRNLYDGGKGLPWHSIEDWDNFLGLSLVYGTYWWWYVFTGSSLILGASACFL